MKFISRFPFAARSGTAMAKTPQIGPGWDWTIAFDGTRTPVKTALFVLVCVVWVLPGLIGHQPWKGDEATTFGVVWHILKTGEWLVPTLAGEPFLERPPLYYLVAALFAKVFSFALPVYDAARLASGFFTGIALLFTALASRALLDERFGRLAVIIMLGTLGLILRLHEMVSDTALFATFAMGYYGLAIARQKPRWAALWLGLGLGLGFLAKGFVAPALLGAISLALPVFFRPWRVRAYGQFASLALVIALPLVLIWPAALYFHSEALFYQWLYSENWDVWRVLVLSRNAEDASYYFRILPWYTWPALPMAMWTLWRTGLAGLARPEIHLPSLSFIVILLVLSLGPNASEAYALPLLVPLAGLAAAGVDTIRRGAVGALDWFGLLTFGVFSAALWLGWLALRIGAPENFVAWVQSYQPGFAMPFNGLAFAAALGLSLVYIATITRTRRSNRRAIVNWTSGITVFWLLAMTLWLPLIDAGRSYRSTLAELKQALPAASNCVASRGLGDAQRALLDYYIGLVTQRLENGEGAECGLLLVQGVAGQESPLPVAWTKIWVGSRPGDKVERLRLYRRNAT